MTPYSYGFFLAVDVFSCAYSCKPPQPLMKWRGGGYWALAIMTEAVSEMSRILQLGET